MLSKNIEFINFKKKLRNPKIRIIWKKLEQKYLDKSQEVLSSLSKKYNYSYKIKRISRFKRFKKYKIFGMGGSILGAQAIYSFLSKKIKKKFIFINNLNNEKKLKNEKNFFNIIISKSGNTLETISNFNSSKINKNCIFITENKKSFLRELALKMKADIIDHNKFIGGRYSVLSETGMLPASLMGLKPEKFKRFDELIKRKSFLDQLIANVSSILYFHKIKKNNSIILNYDDSSRDLFFWYQQLVAESLGKNSKGILPIISTMPKDNHSVMQFYLDGVKNNFYTLFFSKEHTINKINKKSLINSYSYLKNKNLNNILFSQFRATQEVFKRKKIPFRSFIIDKKNEETLGELFTFFILETILLGMALKINPFDQPDVELIKKETIRTLKKN